VAVGVTAHHDLCGSFSAVSPKPAAYDVLANGGDGFSGEALEYVRVVAGQDEDADTVLDGQVGQCLRSLLAREDVE
jgi:hypothetical protein